MEVPGTLWGKTADVYNKYLVEIGAILSRDSPLKETHMSLIGGLHGRLLIGTEHTAWLRTYTTELERNHHSLFLAERRTPIFRMHFDLDFSQPTAVTSDELVDIARSVVKVFRGFYPKVPEDDDRWQTVILEAPPKRVEKNGKSLVKSGCHLIWNNLYVDQAIALQMRLNVVDYFNRNGPPRSDECNPYDDVFDKTVLTSNGLRMYGSDKGMICSACRRKPPQCRSCETCLGVGVLIENRAYTLSTVVTPNGERDVERTERWKRDVYTCVRNSSTRSSHTSPTPGFWVPPNAVSDAGVKRARRTGTSIKKTDIDTSSPVMEQLRAHIASMNPAWIDLSLKEVLADKDRYICHVQGPGSLYCTNAKRAHSSSEVYFTVSHDGLRQRCFSHKTANGVRCKQYASPPRSISRWLSEALFGKMDKVDMGNPFTDDKDNTDKLKTYKKYLCALTTMHKYTTPDDAAPHPDYPGLTVAQVRCFDSYCRYIDKKKTVCMFQKEMQQRCMISLGDPAQVYTLIRSDQGPMKRKRTKK